MDKATVIEWAQFGIFGISVLFTVFAVVGAFRSGVLTKIRMGSHEISPNAYTRQVESTTKDSITGKDNIPFEVEQLTNYYSQVLSQSKISFWFSLVFASLGFVVIIVAAFSYTRESIGTPMAQFIAGTIMEAVASLFFVQSKSAQRSMGDFFDKLRTDRLHLESRKICESVEDRKSQDALKVHLSLHYAGVTNPGGVATHISENVLTNSNYMSNADSDRCGSSPVG